MHGKQESNDVNNQDVSAEILDKKQNFAKILEDINSVDDKKKKLWQEIYDNAIIDRQNAYIMFSKLSALVEDKSTEHAIHGKTMATFIERMSRSNDQLIKLAELIAAAEDKQSKELSPDDIFDKIKSPGF